MGVSSVTNNAGSLALYEMMKTAKKPPPGEAAKIDAVPKLEQPQRDSHMSEIMTLEEGGTVIRNTDGDTAELSARGLTDSEVAASINAETQATATREQEDPPAVPEPTTAEIRYQARQLLIQGQIDLNIKNRTGITQAELNRIKAELDEKAAS